MGESSSSRCLNCGRSLNGSERYCPACGQSTRTGRIGLRSFLSTFIDNYLALDAKWLRSTLLLLAKPGFLAAEYVKGRRVRYTHPFRMLFAVTLLFFLAAGWLRNKHKEQAAQPVQVNVNYSAGRIVLNDTLPFAEKVAGMALQLLSEQNTADSATVQLTHWGLSPTGENLRAYAWASRFARIAGNPNDRQNFIQYFTSKISWALFLFLPLFGLLIYPLFLKTKRNYAEQLVLIFYVQSAFFLGMLASMLLNAVWPLGLWTLLIWLWFTYYLVRSYRTFFDLPVRAVLWRMLLIVPLYGLVAGLALGLTALAGLWSGGFWD